MIARFGGDEFLALFEACRRRCRGRGHALRRGGIRALAEPPIGGGHRGLLDRSVGIATTTEVANEATTLLSNAEAAMYRAKLRGGSSVEVFGESMRIAVGAESTEHSLHRALERGELMLYYQPVVEIGGRGRRGRGPASGGSIPTRAWSPPTGSSPWPRRAG